MESEEKQQTLMSFLSSWNILKFEVIVEHQLNGIWCVKGRFGQGLTMQWLPSVEWLLLERCL